MILLCDGLWAQEPQDPFALIQYHKLNNGMEVYLAPSPSLKLVRIEVGVDVGMVAEDESNIGVSHLLEHALFRDESLPKNASFLDLVEEAGGSANGFTQPRATRYVAEIPKHKGAWLLRQMAKMLVEKKITDEEVEKSRGEVFLERGRPSALTQLLGFSIADLFRLDALQLPTFWETEFGIKPYKNDFTLAEEQLSTGKLSGDQVRQHYHDYYYPENMRVYIAGNFSAPQYLQSVKKHFGRMPARKGKKLPELNAAELRDKVYIRSRSAGFVPSIDVGVKLWQIDEVDERVVLSYINYLGLRIMKKIRNEQGNTYTVQNDYDFRQKMGFAGISMEAPADSYGKILEIVLGKFRKEAFQGQFSEEDYLKAKDLYLKHLLLSDQDSGSLIHQAQQLYHLHKDYGVRTSPYAIAKALTYEEYRQRLKKIFQEKRLYQILHRPHVLFRGEKGLGVIVLLFASFFFFKSFWIRPFQNDRLRWVRKIKYPPAMIFEGILLISVVVFALFLFYPVGYATAGMVWLHLLPFPVDYITLSLYSVLVVALAVGVFAMVPRKLMVVGEDLVIKAISFHSQKIPLEKVKVVESLHWWQILVSWRRLRALFYRQFYLNPLLWQKGIWLELENGRAYFFSISRPEEAEKELRQFLPSSNSNSQETPALRSVH